MHLVAGVDISGMRPKGQARHQNILFSHICGSIRNRLSELGRKIFVSKEELLGVMIMLNNRPKKSFNKTPNELF
jgi:hypothetical protein